jgi:tRNA (cmo5U34)-methyltransferase
MTKSLIRQELTAKTQSLSRQDFFFVRQHNYDDLAERSLPHYREGHDILMRILAAHAETKTGAPTRALDLGTGSGVTADAVLKALPHVTLTAVDLFPEMIDDATHRLAHWGQRVRLVAGDNTDFLRANSEKFDIVTAAFCIHHLDVAGKQDIFTRIYDALQPGGLFILLDLTTFADPILRANAHQDTESYMRSRVADANIQAEWLNHWNNINKPDPADDQVAWLRRAGFQAETVCRWFEVALISARRP